MKSQLKIIGILIAVLVSNIFTNLSAANFPPFDESIGVQAKPASLTKWPKLPEALRDTELCLHGVALFSGSSVYGTIVKEATGSKWSHTGMILCPQKDRNQSSWYLLEACHFPGRPFYEISSYNVHVLPWADSSFSQNNDVAVRALEYGNGAEPSSDMVKDVISKYIGVPYERHPSELFRAAFDANKKEDVSSLFCSEANALVLQDLGLLSRNVMADNYVPADFSIGRPYALRLTGVRLGSELTVKEATRFGLASAFNSFKRALRFWI